MELMDIIFASGQRSLESLCIAFATTDRLTFPAASPVMSRGGRRRHSPPRFAQETFFSRPSPPAKHAGLVCGITCGDVAIAARG